MHMILPAAVTPVCISVAYQQSFLLDFNCLCNLAHSIGHFINLSYVVLVDQLTKNEVRGEKGFHHEITSLPNSSDKSSMFSP